MTNEINKNLDLDQVSDFLRENSEKAEQKMQDVLNGLDIVDTVSENIEKARETIQNQLNDLVVDINESDNQLLNVLKGAYKEIDKFINRETQEQPAEKIGNDFEEFENLRKTVLAKEDPAATVGAFTYTVTSEMLSPQMGQLSEQVAGKSRMDLLLETNPNWSDGFNYMPDFKEALIAKLSVPENKINEVVTDIQETALKSAEAACYIAATLGVSTASVFEDAARAVYAPVFLAQGDQERLQNLLLNTKSDELQAKLDEFWKDAGLSEVWANTIKEFGESAAVIGLTVLATSGALAAVPAAAVAITAATLLDMVDTEFVNSIIENGELTFKDVIASAGTAAATFAVMKVLPFVNEQLTQYAPKISQLVSSVGVEKVSEIGKITGTIVKAAIGAADAAMFQGVTETRKLIRYGLGLDEDYDIKQELKDSAVNIALGSAISGAGYFLKETVRNSQAFSKVVKLFTGHEYVAKYDEFAKVAMNEVKTEPQGGSYRDVKNKNTEAGKEVHHTPADSTSSIDRNDGPTVKMDADDHHKTASYDSSKEAREYRQRQAELIQEGKLKDAIQMDIDDIRYKFGSKYDEAIKQMLAYADEMIEKGAF